VINFFQDKWYTGPVYGGDEINWYGGENSLNPEGQKYVNTSFFPAVSAYINQQRAKETPNLKNIAILNYAVKSIWYDYFLQAAQ
jgi:hypothetical protein